MTKRPNKARQPASKRATSKPRASGSLRGRALGRAADEFGDAIAPLGAELGKRIKNAILGGLSTADEVIAYIRDALANRLRDVPREEIVDPSPRIAISVARALGETLTDPVISSMFADLLAAAMQKGPSKLVHPAFVTFVQQMEPLDALILRTMHSDPQLVFEMRLRFSADYLLLGKGSTLDHLGEPESVQRSLNNLIRLGLIEVPFNRWPNYADLDAKIALFRARFKDVADAIAKGAKLVDREEPGTLQVDHGGIYITKLGIDLVKVSMTSGIEQLRTGGKNNK